jgi:hypothetical protein
MRRKNPPPKKKLPFLSRVSGRAGQRRPDRRAPPQRELRRVFNKADADLLNPFDPPAPPGGKITQQFTGDKAIPRPKGLKKGGAVKKRAVGGTSDDDSPTVPRSSSLADLAAVGLTPMAGITDVGAGAPPPLPPPVSDAPGPLRAKRGGGVLSAAQRQSLPKSDFALPGKGKGPKGAGSGSYPIPDRSHAANALARSSGKPVAAQVRAKVKAKYPDMGS